jgi:hypothetical protein
MTNCSIAIIIAEVASAGAFSGSDGSQHNLNIARTQLPHLCAEQRASLLEDGPTAAAEQLRTCHLSLAHAEDMREHCPPVSLSPLSML